MQPAETMKRSSITVGLLVVASAACGARPTPAARVGSAEAAVRAARESGAPGLPDAALHLRLAEDQVTRARRLIQEGEHERAQWLLVRAEADATLAQALAQEAQQKNAAEVTTTRARELATQGAPR
jgi:hypothetical protein